MLSRTADNLFWMARYMERAENTARLLAGLHHMSLLPARKGGVEAMWESLFQTEFERQSFLEKHQKFTTRSVLTFMILDKGNPSSIKSCIWSARENVRATRHVLTTELWESVNETWGAIADVTYGEIDRQGVWEYLENIKNCAHLFRGVAYGTLRRGEAFDFWQLGAYIERAENTVRLLATRADSFNDGGRKAGDQDLNAADYYQWGTLLRAVNAYKAYREVYRSQIQPRRVAELMILNDEMPRSLVACIEETRKILDELRPEAKCNKQAAALCSRLRSARIDRLYRTGISVFLADFRGRTHDLSVQLQKDFLMIR